MVRVPGPNHWPPRAHGRVYPAHRGVFPAGRLVVDHCVGAVHDWYWPSMGARIGDRLRLLGQQDLTDGGMDYLQTILRDVVLVAMSLWTAYRSYRRFAIYP